nr:MAG TPA: tail sheath protein [Caudoviricetes sp.]
MTIPLSTDFNITPNVVTPAGSAVDANGLMLTDNELIPVGAVQSYFSSADVSALMGSESKEFLAAQQYFNGYENSSVIPGELLMYRIVTADVAGYLLSGNLKGVALATLKAIPAGTITLSVDGVSTTSASIDLSTATSFSDIADKLETGIGASKVSVEWLPIANRFIIRSATTGADSEVSFASDGVLATGLLLTAATAATVSPGSDAVTLTDTMNNIINTNQNWILFNSLVELTDDQKGELCAWANSSKNRYGYVVHDTTQAGTIANNANCFVQQVVVANGYENIFPVYGTYLYSVTALAYAASIDFARTNGRISFKFRGFSGLAPNVSDLATAQALKSNGYNFYGSYSLNKTMAQYASDGAITGKFVWLDSFIDQVWINANLVGAFANLFTNNQSYPFNATGYGAVSAAVIDVAEQALNFGAIQRGVTLDNAQIRIVNNTVGKDISATLYSQGWFLYIPTQPGSARIERDLQGVIFYYVDGQLIQSITMSSTAIL